MFRICFVCTGNICRSPMAETVMRHLLEEAGLAGRVAVDSAGTGSWHVGDGADPRALRTLKEAGYDGSAHRARVFDRRWFAGRDLIVALDRGHLSELRALAVMVGGDVDKLRLLRSFAPDAVADDLDVADPYYGGPDDFGAVLAQVEQGCRGILDHLHREGVVAA